MKKTAKILTVALASVAALAMTGCAQTVKNVTPTSSNWYPITTYSNIYETTQTGSREKLLYDVRLVKDSATNESYSVEYAESGNTYSTEFYAINYDWSTSGIDAYKTDAKEVVYVLETELKLSGKYTLKSGDSTEAFNDYTKTVCYFRSAGDNLAPVYSYYEVSNTTPVALTATSVDALAKRMEYTCETFYNKGCTQATAVYTDASGSKTDKVIDELDESGYSLFDGASIYFAMRAMDTNGSDFSKTVSVVIPVEGKYKNYAVTSSGAAELDESQTQIKDALVAAGYCRADEKISYNAVTSTLIADMTGMPQTAWYASVSDANKNWCRSTMLKYSLSLSYGLGTLEYVLNTVESTLEA